MKRFRWIAILLAGVAIVALGAVSVMARSTYTNHAITASSFTSNGDPDQWHPYADHYGSGGWWWLGAGESAKWTFDVSGLQVLARSSDTAILNSATLNFAALSTSPQGGSGFATTIKVVASGQRITTGTASLMNPWKPHIGAFSQGVGWDSHAAVPIPSSVWAGADTLTVVVTPATPGNWIAMNQDAVVIGYASF
jgi:hypothetical protein